MLTSMMKTGNILIKIRNILIKIENICYEDCRRRHGRRFSSADSKGSRPCQWNWWVRFSLNWPPLKYHFVWGISHLYGVVKKCTGMLNKRITGLAILPTTYHFQTWLSFAQETTVNYFHWYVWYIKNIQKMAERKHKLKLYNKWSILTKQSTSITSQNTVGGAGTSQRPKVHLGMFVRQTGMYVSIF